VAVTIRQFCHGSADASSLARRAGIPAALHRVCARRTIDWLRMPQLKGFGSWRMPLVAVLIAAVALTGCSPSAEADLPAPSTATDRVAPVAPPGNQPGPFRLGAAPAPARSTS
jgi:hypothetical protein